jgi:hypothetical protein
MPVRDKIVDYTRIPSFAKRYLQTYFKCVDSDENEVARFLAREAPRLKGLVGTFVEIGCGPTIHHLLPICPFVEKIHLADYLHSNLAEVQAWKEHAPYAHDWSIFTENVLKLEGQAISPKHVQDRENLLRNKIGGLSYCNILREFPLGIPTQCDALGFFFCAEEVTTDKDEWKQVMRNTCSLIKPNGFLLMSALRGTDHYVIENEIGYEVLPTAKIWEQDIIDLLPTLGFDLSQTSIEVAETPDQKHQGISSVILISARKLPFEG